MSNDDPDRPALGILVGGGPAPGINAVIAAATIRARLSGSRVLGIRNGFEELMAPDGEPARELDIHDVSRIHFRGGSALGTSRANPTRDPKDLATVVASLRRLGIDRLVTIGGDDTAFSACRVEAQAEGAIRVAHVPKTIDNDLDLPPSIDTFGYQTARSVGVGIVQNLMVDAKTTSRWYVVVAMGRKAGHLALGIGKAAGATLTIIPEEFGTHDVTLDAIVDTIVGAIIKRRVEGREDGVVLLAEGLVLGIDPATLEELDTVERDAHGHVRIAEIDFGDIIKGRVRTRLRALGLETTVVAKDLGYELRCADPISFDMDYCRDLGYCAAKYLLEGGSGALVSMQGGRFVPVPFGELIDAATGRMQVRLVDLASTRYAIARRYMIRLRRDDFRDEDVLGDLAAEAGLSPEAFRERFEYLVEDELPPLVLR
jgi:6-phosphofructokinase